jgi:hypothetical protein
MRLARNVETRERERDSERERELESDRLHKPLHRLPVELNYGLFPVSGSDFSSSPPPGRVLHVPALPPLASLESPPERRRESPRERPRHTCLCERQAAADASALSRGDTPFV